MAVLPDAPAVEFTDMASIVTLLGQTTTDVRRGTLDCKIANCVGYLCGVALKAIQQGDVEARLTAVEEALAAAKNGRSR
jgi:hypothetical protein